MLRKENKLSSRLAVRSTIPDTSMPPKKEIRKLMSFDITGIVLGKTSVLFMEGKLFKSYHFLLLVHLVGVTKHPKKILQAGIHGPSNHSSWISKGK